MELIKLVHIIAVFIAAMILGNWYLAEYRRIRAARLPAYRAYFSPPGVMIILVIILLPVLARFIQN